MLTLPAALTNALVAGLIDPVVYVKIEKTGMTTIETVTRPWLSYVHGISEVGSFSAELDPMDRKSKVGNLAITSNNDGYLYGLAIANQLRGARVTVLWGATSAGSTSDLAPLFKGTCESVATDAVNRTCVLSCSDYLATLRDRSIVGRFLNMHPLEIIEQILTEVDGGLGFDGSVIDETSLDPTSHADIEHWVVSRGTQSANYKDTSISTPTSSKQLIDELAALMDGQLVCLEDGVLKFRRFLAGETAADNWTDDDFLDIKLDHADQNLRNQVSCAFNTAEQLSPQTTSEGTVFDFITPPALLYRETNLDSAEEYASPDQEERIVEHKHDTKWVEGDALIFGPFTVPGENEIPDDLAAGEWVVLRAGLLHGFCGTRSPGFAFGLGTFEPTLKLDDDHLAYIRFNDEIIAFDRCEIMGEYVDYATQSAEVTSVSDALDFLDTLNHAFMLLPGAARFRIAERGALGTTAAYHQGVYWLDNTDTFGSVVYSTERAGTDAHDVTIPVAFVQAKIQRFSRGAPQVTVRTPLNKYALQIGDIVTITTDLVGYYGHDGLDDDDKWEITSKQFDLFGDEPCITWRLVWAYAGDGDPVVSNKRITLGDRIIQRRQPSSDHNVMKPTIDGHEIAAGSGLSVDIERGMISSKDGTRIGGDVNVPLAPSSDNHVYVDRRTNQISVTPVAVGDPPPPPAPSAVRIGTVTTDGTGVTTVLDQRNTTEALREDAVTPLANAGLQPNRSFGIGR